MILVVDDESDASRVLALLLRRSGHPTHTVAGASAAIDYLTRADPASLPQLIILDQMMPDLTGIDCLRALKSTPALAGIPVIMYSADFSDEPIRQARTLGAAAYLVKGVVPWRDLLALVEQHAPAHLAPSTHA